MTASGAAALGLDTHDHETTGEVMKMKQGEDDVRPPLSYSNHCKEVDEKMETETQRKLDDYVALYGAISEKTDNDAVAVAILQELSKDRRSGEIRVERAAKNGEANANEPATEKQKKFMKKLNIAFPANVTKHEASTLLDEELARIGE
jgi:hypothetical protein